MPHIDPTADARSVLFRTLRPICVALSQAAHALNGPNGSIKEITTRLEDLKTTLIIDTKSQLQVLDSKLADYAFFPISQVLKVSQKVSVRCLELGLECIPTLIESGWRQEISPPLAAQLMILCTLMAQKRPKGFKFDETTPELQTNSLRCLHAICVTVGAEARQLLTSETNFPQLGQTISVVLDALHDEESNEVQAAATQALQALVARLADRELCAGFLPGMVSKLTRILTPTTKQRRSHFVLVECLNVLAMLIWTTLNNTGAEGVASAYSKVARLETRPYKPSIITEEWKKNAAIQLKTALTPIMRLQSHSRDDVKESLAQLCLLLLEHCRQTLQSCSQLAMDTLVTVCIERTDSSARSQLDTLLRSDLSLSTLLQNTLYGWLQSLTTTMQSSDEQAKTQKMQRITTAYGLLVNAGANTSSIERMIASTLRDSVIITLQDTPNKQQKTFVSPMQSMDLAVLGQDLGSNKYHSPLVKYRGQEEVMNRIEKLVNMISAAENSSSFIVDVSRTLHTSQGEAQLANFWLLLTATLASLKRQDAINDFLYVEDGGNIASNDHVEELYSFSLSILTDISDEPLDPRLQGLALRSLALRAQTTGKEFRYELIDALYPVLHTLATPEDQLQRDSITTLNIFTASCGYSSVKDLIVDNVDYLTNAVALKLNAFDVLPQAPQVLLLMVKLTGPSLLPYLEDTVETIFAVLEDYHGYPLLVELLFKVLGAVAEEGAKTPLLAIGNGSKEASYDVLRERWQPTTMERLKEQIRERAQNDAKAREDKSVERQSHPQRPWKRFEEVEESDEQNDDETVRAETDPAEEEEPPPSDTDVPPPAPKTYALLLKITDLTQHFLPSASPSLRSSLLALIKTTIPAIAQHENSFLPLINTLWPEVVSRLDDKEPQVQALALKLVATLCEHARGFMRSRITQFWPRVREMYGQVIADITGLASSSSTKWTHSHQIAQPSTFTLTPDHLTQLHTPQSSSTSVATTYSYIDTPTRHLFNALIEALTAIVRHTPMDPQIFDEMLEMLGPAVLETRDRLRGALEEVNGDAVWLVMRMGKGRKGG